MLVSRPSRRPAVGEKVLDRFGQPRLGVLEFRDGGIDQGDTVIVLAEAVPLELPGHRRAILVGDDGDDELTVGVVEPDAGEPCAQPCFQRVRDAGGLGLHFETVAGLHRVDVEGAGIFVDRQGVLLLGGIDRRHAKQSYDERRGQQPAAAVPQRFGQGEISS